MHLAPRITFILFDKSIISPGRRILLSSAARFMGLCCGVKKVELAVDNSDSLFVMNFSQNWPPAHLKKEEMNEVWKLEVKQQSH